ncbi:MAG: ketopantoate reductase family protein [Methanosarcinales archaeon]|nr:ketopantoate reductase family protein [Methanosarcinales archaeon]
MNTHIDGTAPRTVEGQNPRESRNIAIMGAGAIGSVIGGMLARQGHRVTLIGRQPHMDAIARDGLHISGIWGEHTVRSLAACTAPPVPCPDRQHAKHKDGYQDMVFITVKSFDTALAAREVLTLVGPDTMVISMQNGLGNVETLAGIVGRDRMVGGMAIFGAVMTGPGSVEVTVIASETLLGELDRPPAPRVEAAARMLDDAGIPTLVSDNIMRDIWHKALYNIALNPLSALFQVPYGRIADNPHTRWLIGQMITEAFEVARAEGIDLGLASPQEFLQILWERKLPPTREHRSSMLQDIVRGRRTEIDYINGAVVRLGEEHGIGTPYNSAVLRMVKAKEGLGLSVNTE